MLDLLKLDELTAVCLHLDLRDLIRVAQASKIFRHGDSRLETAELLTKLPVITALLKHAFPGGEMIPNTRPTSAMRSRRSCRLRCPESWVAYLARCARQRRCR
jgi:hypothetical protein